MQKQLELTLEIEAPRNYKKEEVEEEKSSITLNEDAKIDILKDSIIFG